jgi:3-deoxy-D-manno-octulosonic-acid transferase
MRALYNIFFTIFFILASPYYFLRLLRRGNWRPGFAQRFGKYDSKFKQAITNRQTLWIHAVSVGEVNICTHLIRMLEPRLPNVKIVVSTTTTTGMADLERKLPSHISKIFYPIDMRRIVSRALHTVRPKAIVLVESEIWPNFLWRARRMGVPLFLVNARLSQRSYPRYKAFGFLFRPLFEAFTGVGAQTEVDAARLRTLGCRPECIRVVGSLKYDAARVEERKLLDVPEMFRQLGLSRQAPVLVCGSTHPGEEVVLARIFLRLRKKFPELFLVLVPRHFERCRDVGRELDAEGIRFVYRNEITNSTQFRSGEIECLLVNTTGELKHFYEQATLIFVGKSLTAQGGQNPIEPGALGKAMAFGPHMQNFAEIARSFVQRQAAVQVKDAEELENTFARLLGDSAERDLMGGRALEVVRENLGAIQRTVSMILEGLEDGELYVAPERGSGTQLKPRPGDNAPQ